jgi:hypothetical protein
MAESDKTSFEKGNEELRRRMHELEENPPEKLEDWPDDELKYETFGGGEGDHSYDEGPERKLGPSSLQRHEDGSITIEGEEVDNPDDYKADEPVEAAVESTKERQEKEESGDSDDEDGDSDGDDD